MVRVVAAKDGQLAVHIATQKGNRVAEKDGSNASGDAPESQSRGPELLVLLKTTLHTEPFAGGLWAAEARQRARVLFNLPSENLGQSEEAASNDRLLVGRRNTIGARNHLVQRVITQSATAFLTGPLVNYPKPQGCNPTPLGAPQRLISVPDDR